MDISAGLITQEHATQAVKENMEFFHKSLEKTITELLETYPQKQGKIEKGELKKIYISLLLTSVPFKMPLYRIDFCDKEGQLDQIEHAEYWDISPVSEIIYTDMFSGDNPYYQLSSKENYNNEQNWFENAKVLHAEIKKLIPLKFELLKLSKKVELIWKG